MKTANGKVTMRRKPKEANAAPNLVGWVLVVLAALPTGCATLRDALGFEKQARSARQLARIEGRIDTEAPAEGPLVVVLARPGETESDPLVGVDTFVRSGPGSFAFAVTPGRYHLGAYEDRNQSGRLDPGERTQWNRGAPLLEVGPGQVAKQDLVLARDATTPPEVTEPIDVFGLVTRTPREQLGFSLWAWSAQGEICPDLRDARFGSQSGRRGLWQVMDFLNEGLAGVYFLAPYDPDRIPVLFVHGIGGSPQEFLPLIEALDHERFQPWFYFYPSGFLAGPHRGPPGDAARAARGRARLRGARDRGVQHGRTGFARGDPQICGPDGEG